LIPFELLLTASEIIQVLDMDLALSLEILRLARDRGLGEEKDFLK
jgi:hypothetical protein